MTIKAQLGGHLFHLGDQGPVVVAIQQALAARGYPLKGTGYFGNATDTAVEAFQRHSGLHVDGEVGDLTAAALDATIPLTTSVVHAEISTPLWLQAGYKLLGVHEGVGSKDNPEIIDWAKEEGGDIARSYTHDSIPWCALLANHLLTSVGLKGTGTLWALDFANPAKWPCVRLDAIAVGCFMPMERSGGGHITICAGKDGAGHAMGLGGNQSDAVTIAAFALSRLNKGFWWPKGVPLPAKTGFGSLPIVSSSGKISTNEA